MSESPLDGAGSGQLSSRCHDREHRTLGPDGHARARLALYRSYPQLIMLVEAVPRGYTGPGHERRAQYVSRELAKALSELAELSDRA
ncbi:hypothetical protein NE857_11310 [Nocardiopsis exhalans]|uniref:Uncharacterized protein n=1 Tax=Nocardiopsis exhalans TaxID=163604 RepID=A0ABY5DGH4_9ACTN|nr:hypothetical protein [Nocardiopsis exhalans]USY22138.1 hypothetical protein NE857_11310 [Nocardiopsis exhalans]